MMDDKKLLSLPHKPVTRRDFLSLGLTSFSAMSFLPTPISLVSRAWADETCGSSANNSIPFLVIDCAGGAALPANFLVGGPQGATDLLPSYSQLGWDPRKGIFEGFGLPMATNDSQILAGINGAATAEARANVRMGSFCHLAQSDNGNNPLSAVALISEFGNSGTALAQAIGTDNSLSGGNSRAAFAKASFRPLYVNSVNTLVESATIDKNSALAFLSSTSLTRVLGLGKLLSKMQLESLGDSVSGRFLERASVCSADENKKKIGGAQSGLDPRLVPELQQIYQINSSSNPSSFDCVSAGIVNGVLKGLTGPGVISIGGCDYHVNNQAVSDAKDREIGVTLGRAIQAAHIMKKPLMIQLITDGGCSNVGGSRVFVSDSNEKCMSVIAYYRPQGPAAQKRVQVGYYTEGQGAALDALTGLGSSPLKAAASVFANYLSLHVPSNTLSSELFKYVKSDLFAGAEEVEKVLIF